MRVLLLGATGTIGQSVAQALVARGYRVTCPVRTSAGFKGSLDEDKIRALLPGADLVFVGNTLDAFIHAESLQRKQIEVIVSCLASRTGAPADAWKIDYGVHSALLKQARRAGVRQMVLLSAICVQKPRLEFQRAKLAFEHELMESGLCYSIVRPTAFFKSLSGQLKRIREGRPYLLFGDGQLTACKPISNHDLASYMASCIDDQGKHNAILPIGGPGEAITPLQQGEYLFKQLRMTPRYRRVPVAMMDVIIGGLSLAAYLLPPLSNKAELAKIGRYYATESMLLWDQASARYDAAATPSYGHQTLFAYYDQLIAGEQQPILGDHAVF